MCSMSLLPAIARNRLPFERRLLLTEVSMIVMRLALVILLLLPAPGLRPGQGRQGRRQGLQRRSGPSVADAAGLDRGEGGDRRFRAVQPPRGLGAGARRRSTRSPKTRRCGSSTARRVSSSRSSAKRRSILAALPPDGQAAYRLFYDAEAKKLLDEAEGPAELKNLERIYSAYFITSVGDNAADRLGDLYFELGRFDRAADCWLAVLRERPDTDLSPALAGGEGRAGALPRGAPVRIRAGPRRAGGSLQRREGHDRRPDGARPASCSAVLIERRAMGRRDRGSSASAPADRRARDLAATVDPAWQLRFAESVEAGMTPLELTQWESNTLSAVVPAVAIDGSTLLRQLPRPYLRPGPEERQDALAVGVVPQPRDSWRMQNMARDARPEPVRDRRLGRARLGAWPAT